MSAVRSPNGRSTLSSQRQAVLTVAAAALLAGPIVLAFFSGGFFDGAADRGGGDRVDAGGRRRRVVAPAAARVPRCAVGDCGLGLLAAWTLASFLWSPLAGTAYHDGQRVFLYLGALLAAAMLLRGGITRVVEPALAAGTFVVIGYGVSERLLPGLLTFSHSTSARVA